MNDLNIACFMSVIRTQNFSVTAKEFNLTQQAVSKRIKKLESELGGVLFAGTSPPTKLTQLGKQYYRWCKELDQTLFDLDLSSELCSPDEGRPLRAGWCDITGCPKPLYDYILLSAEKTGCISCWQGNISEVMGWICNRLIDLAFIPARIAYDLTGVSVSKPILRVAVCAVVKNGYPFEDVKSVVDLEGLPLLVILHENRDRKTTFENTHATCGKAGITPGPVMLVSNLDSTLAEVSFGNGFSILPMTAKTANNPRLKTIPLGIEIDIVMVKNPLENSKILSAFVAGLLSHLSESSEKVGEFS